MALYPAFFVPWDALKTLDMLKGIQTNCLCKHWSDNKLFSTNLWSHYVKYVFTSTKIIF